MPRGSVGPRGCCENSAWAGEGGATVVATEHHLGTFAGVHLGCCEPLTITDRRLRIVADPPQPPWQCGGQGVRVPSAPPRGRGR